MREAPRDRTSSLPESLLHHIHSFFDIKEGARTSVLSKRWNYVWITVPTLHFSKPWCLAPTSLETEEFMDFVDGTLSRHTLSNVDKFSLTWSDHLNEKRVHNWIASLIRGKVKEIGLNLRQKEPLFIPLSLFTCESLISLQLVCRPSIRLPKYISFPRLKRLELWHFTFTEKSWNEQLFSNAPVLEELILRYCNYRMRNFCLSVPKVKLLNIFTFCDGENDLQDCIFKIDAPRLVTFSYSGYIAKEFVLSSFNELVDADIYISFEDESGGRTHQLLYAIAHVQCLTVYDKTLQAIFSSYNLSNNLPTFQNVKRLEIADSLTTDQGLIALLRAVPNLESLVFLEYFIGVEEENSDADDDDNSDDADSDGDADNEDQNPYFVEDEDNHNNEDERDESDASESDINDECGGNYGTADDNMALDTMTTGCLFPHLKSVFFMEFVGNQKELELVKLILKYAKALEKMSIHYTGLVNPESYQELTAEITNFPRASAGCVIELFSWNGEWVVLVEEGGGNM